MIKTSLNGTWKLRGRRQDSNDPFIEIPATVPGCVQLDLSKNGYLPSDLYMGENILETEKFEDYEWWYERTFTAPSQKNNVYLVFGGVDCIAEYFLKGEKIGESDNMFIEHEFRIDKYLKDGENTLAVHIFSPVLAGEDNDFDLKLIMRGRGYEGQWIRRAPHSYGWDIMPRAVTSGLWRNVTIEERDELYFDQLFLTPWRGREYCVYSLSFEDRCMDGVEIEIEAKCGDSEISARKPINRPVGEFYFVIPNEKKWMPFGYGEPNVYDGNARIYRHGELIHEEPISFGVRNIELRRESSAHGKAGDFRLFVNGVEVFCKGTNWVPLDAFHSRDAERYDEALALLKDIGCNIVRCWGGNVYEDHKFFDFCDRNGIMVWQDFAMACSYYPEYDSFKEKMRIEVTSVIRKLRMHPSIVIWAGDNEVDAGGAALYDPDSNSITRDVIPKCIELNDIGRPYIPSSPYITHDEYAEGNTSQKLGTPLAEDHLWGPRDYFKSDFYRDNKARFVSETGYHGCPDLNSIRKFITPERVWPYKNNPEWILHSTDQNGNDDRVMLMEKQIRQLFGFVPTDPEEYIIASQISQAEADKYFIERLRVARPKKTGIIWWNLLDGWPQMSDAVVGYYFDKKIAYRYIKRCQAPFAVIADEISGWGLPIMLCNDTPEKKTGHLTVKDAETDELLFEGNFTAPKNSSTRLTKLPIYFSEHRMLIFEWEADGERGFNHYLCGFPPFSLENYLKAMKKYGL